MFGFSENFLNVLIKLQNQTNKTKLKREGDTRFEGQIFKSSTGVGGQTRCRVSIQNIIIGLDEKSY